jgi:hypothetical protein
MDTDTILKSHPCHLAKLIQADPETVRGWDRDELADVLRHQLAVPLTVDLKLDPATEAEALESSSIDAFPAGSAKLTSFGDVLRHPSPPLSLLQLIKDFAKAKGVPGDSPLPREVATVLYYTAIILARVRHGSSITSLPDAGLLAALRWALLQHWLDPQVRELFNTGAALLKKSAA